MSLLEERISNLVSADIRTEDYKIDADSYYQNPFLYIKKTIEKAHEYKQFNETEDFVAVIVRQIILTSDDEKAFAVGKIEHADQKELGNYSFFNIIIPNLDSHLPIPKDLNDTVTINAFYNNNSRIAYYNGVEKIHPGFLVRVKHPIAQEKNKKFIEIDKVYSKEKFDISTFKNVKDVLQKCITPLKLDSPADVIKPEILTNGNLTTTDGVLIFSSRDFNQKEDSEKNSPILSFGNTPSTTQPVVSEEKKKQDILAKTVIKGDTVDNCNDIPPAITPQQPSEVKPAVFLKDSFVKNNITDESTKIDLEASMVFFNSLSTHPLALILSGSDDPTSNNPVINRLADDREVSMVVVKNVPYLNVETYYKAINNDKVGACHFCIDNNGTIFQFTDTKNYVRSFNPTIDEISIHIALINLSFRNSKKTKNLLDRGFKIEKIGGSRNSALASSLNVIASVVGSRPPEVADLKLSLISDRIILQNYLNAKTGISREVIDDLTYPDGIDVQPPYRLDASKEQKNSLKKLIKAINKGYTNILLKIPDINGYSPDVAVGDFTGIVAPYHFSLSQVEPVNFKQIMEEILKA